MNGKTLSIKAICKKGDKVLLTTPGINPEMEDPRTGPYEVIEVYNNGTVTIQDGPVCQRVNIRRIMLVKSRVDICLNTYPWPTNNEKNGIYEG